ncbi:MAG: hypothetical protein EOO14_06345 [Chitinophagaceae bacterium]|nr:MAG: hypothetical protein EOO14_06345 [Chitinophagaceae bacterium]
MLSNIAGWVLAILFFAIGLINACWGNDFEYGVFIVLLSIVFLPPVQGWIKKLTGFTIPLLAKVILALFILWSALGVGELFDKIHLMLEDLWGQ